MSDIVASMAVAVVVITNTTAMDSGDALCYVAFPLAVLYTIYSSGVHRVSWYRWKTSLTGIKRLATMSQQEKDDCVAAYKFFQKMQAGAETKTSDETAAVRAYYAVLNNLLSVADLEKLYIPPEVPEGEGRGLFHNQLLVERCVLKDLNLSDPKEAHLLDMGCGRGRISHHFATECGGKVSGYNIDANQIESAVNWAKQTKMDSVLDFKVADHHQARLPYDDNSFDGAYSFQAVWPFFKKHELDSFCREMFRLLKPGARYACSEYLLTPHFDWNNDEHVRLHKLYLPTLAATQSMYPADVCDSLRRAGFEVIASNPSCGPAWPICEEKRDLILRIRKVVRFLESVCVVGPWLEEALALLQKGGQAWTDAEKAKIADLNWRIVVEKPSLI